MSRRLTALFIVLLWGVPALEGCRSAHPGNGAEIEAKTELARQDEISSENDLQSAAQDDNPELAASAEDFAPPHRSEIPEEALEEQRFDLSLPADLPKGGEWEAVREGWRLFDDSPPSFPQAALSCRNCHLDYGTRPSAFPLTESAGPPRYHPGQGVVLHLEDLIVLCLERSLNAQTVPRDSAEVTALAAFVRWLSEKAPAVARVEISPLDAPSRRADLTAGDAVFQTRCASCHGETMGQERRRVNRPAPPLWGPHSYTSGSGMHRLLSATAFIQGNMPPGREKLSLEEAYDVAAYVNSFDRPVPDHLDRDYPALTEKPVDAPFPPFPDPFPADQHKYGPFPPILEEWDMYRKAERWVYWVAPSGDVPLPILQTEIRKPQGPPHAKEIR